MIVRKSIASFLVVLTCFPLWVNPKNNDTLKGKSFDYLFDRMEATCKNPKQRECYMAVFLRKAKLENNSEETVNGYKNYIHYREGELKITYADSMVNAALSSEHRELIGSAYLTRGIAYYGLKHHAEALDNYLLADSYISSTGNMYLIHKVRYNLAHVKYYLGFYEEAIGLFISCRDYFRDTNERAYLNTLHSLALCYKMLGNYGVCSELTAFGLSEGERLSNTDMDAYFLHTEGINQYFLHNYAAAITKIESALKVISDNGDFANVAVGHFYIGKCYLALRKTEVAIGYFRKVDKTFQEKGYVRPDLRENYELLIRYHKTKNDPKALLSYVDQLLKADSVIRTTQSYLLEKIHKEYDTKQLLREREQAKKQLELQHYKEKALLLVSGLLAVGSLLLAYRYIVLKRTWNRKFEELMRQRSVASKYPKDRSGESTGLDMSQEAFEKLTRQIEKWERDKKYLEKDLSLARLAVAFDSNTKYLSSVIGLHKEKKFTEYINDLKVDYIVELIKTARKFREYSNSGLAEEAGFSTTQRFTKAFVARTGISPTFFIEKLKKKLEQANEKSD